MVRWCSKQCVIRMLCTLRHWCTWSQYINCLCVCQQRCMFNSGRAAALETQGGFLHSSFHRCANTRQGCRCFPPSLPLFLPSPIFPVLLLLVISSPFPSPSPYPSSSPSPYPSSSPSPYPSSSPSPYPSSSPSPSSQETSFINSFHSSSEVAYCRVVW